MKNFFGRVLILIISFVHCVLFFVMLGTFLFFAFQDTTSIQNFFTGKLTHLEYGGISLGIVDLITFIVITLICMVDIIKARSMKHAFIGSIVFFAINMVTFLFNLLMPHLDSFYFGFFLGILITLIVTSVLLTVGCASNYYKDCR